MTFYLIKKGDELHIIPVLPEKEMEFFQLYGQRILASAETIPGLLQAFHELPIVLGDGF